MYEISIQPCCPQVSHYTVFTLVVSCMRSAFSPAAHRSLTTQYLPWWCHVWDQPSVLLPTGPSLHSIYHGGIMYEISLQSCCPQVPHYTVFTLVVSCMRSAFSPAVHRSLTIQYLPWWYHVWDQPSVLLPTGPPLHSINLGGVMYEISLQSCCPQVPHYTVFTLVVSCMRSAFSPAAHRSLTYTVFTLMVSCMRSAFSPVTPRSLTTQYLPWWCHVWDQPSVLLPTGLSGHVASPSSWLCDRENRPGHHTDCPFVAHPAKQSTRCENPPPSNCCYGRMVECC